MLFLNLPPTRSISLPEKKSSRALKIFRYCRQNWFKSGMSDMYAHCVGHCDWKTSIAKLRFRNSDPDKMFRSLPQLNVWARTRNEAGVSNVCMTQILCFGPSKQNSHTKKVLQDRAFIQNRSTGACLIVSITLITFSFMLRGNSEESTCICQLQRFWGVLRHTS